MSQAGRVISDESTSIHHYPCLKSINSTLGSGSTRLDPVVVVAPLSRTTKAHPKAIMMSAANSLASRSSVVPARVRGARKTTVSAIDTPRLLGIHISLSLSEAFAPDGRRTTDDVTAWNA